MWIVQGFRSYDKQVHCLESLPVVLPPCFDNTNIRGKASGISVRSCSLTCWEGGTATITCGTYAFETCKFLQGTVELHVLSTTHHGSGAGNPISTESSNVMTPAPTCSTCTWTTLVSVHVQMLGHAFPTGDQHPPRAQMGCGKIVDCRCFTFG
jgi:hypothetical protein